MRRSFRTHRLGVYYTQGFTLGWYAVPRWGTPENHPTTPHCNTPHRRTPSHYPIAPPRRQRDLGRSAPWRRTPHPLARSAKAHPSQSLLSARRPRYCGARTRDAPFESLSYTAMRRSFRTHRLGVSRTQGFTLGWYAVPRWGTPENHPAAPHCSHTPLQPYPIAAIPHRTTPSHHPGGSGTLAVARLGGEHHTHSRAARKPILPRAS
jgi:hypothetical protein